MREGPSILNKKASAAYKTIFPAEEEQLQQQVKLATSQERQMNKKAIVLRGENILMKIQKLV